MPRSEGPTDAIRNNRVAICHVAGDSLKLGIEILGIAAPDRL
jgi:arginyl-tRNA synthetase